MYARVAKFEGGEPEAVRRNVQEISSQAESGPPEGAPAKGFLLLTDPAHGRGLGISLFETEQDLRKGDEVLNAMRPPSEGMGRRVSVETYEVGLDIRS